MVGVWYEIIRRKFSLSLSLSLSVTFALLTITVLDGLWQLEDWDDGVAANAADRSLIEAMSETEAAGWVERQERAFAELIARGQLSK